LKSELEAYICINEASIAWREVLCK